jgi:lysyl-tRNA synthetase class 2
MLQSIRDFFRQRGILEVETPILAAAGATDPHLASLTTVCGTHSGRPGQRLYLQTSPELAMKRLVAAHGIPIYQLGKAFRDGEQGALHNPEFTLLEWYRPGWDHLALMNEVESFFDRLLGTGPGRRVTYREAFRDALGLDPFDSPEALLTQAATASGLSSETAAGLDRDGCLDFLFSTRVQPALARDRLAFVHDFPASQAALARIRPDSPAVAERFEAFIDGVEVANGYHELTDAPEQRRRFEADLARRRALGLPEPPLDERLLAALEAGLAPCAGVAVGVDRLVMVAARAPRIDAVLAFPLDRV